MYFLLSGTQTRPGRTVKQEQEDISRNHVQTFSGCSVQLMRLNKREPREWACVQATVREWVDRNDRERAGIDFNAKKLKLKQAEASWKKNNYSIIWKNLLYVRCGHVNFVLLWKEVLFFNVSEAPWASFFIIRIDLYLLEYINMILKLMVFNIIVYHWYLCMLNHCNINILLKVFMVSNWGSVFGTF